MCVYIATAAWSVKICVWDLTTTHLLTPRGYGTVCMLVAHNICTIHTETSAPVVCCYYTCMYSTYRIMHFTVLVMVVMLLELKNFCCWVQMSTTMDLWVIAHTFHTIVGVLGINALYTDKISVSWWNLSEITLDWYCGFISHWIHTSKAPPVKYYPLQALRADISFWCSIHALSL